MKTFSKCLYHSTAALARQVNRIAEEEFKAAGFSPTSAFIILEVVAFKKITSGNLSSSLQLAPSTITRMTDKLEKQGYIKRVQEGRNSILTPTKKSLSTHPKIVVCWESFTQRCTLLLGEKTLSKTIKRLNSTAIELG
jgi:DNA-binding MarR family transcriptional regulator